MPYYSYFKAGNFEFSTVLLADRTYHAGCSSQYFINFSFVNATPLADKA